MKINDKKKKIVIILIQNYIFIILFTNLVQYMIIHKPKACKYN